MPNSFHILIVAGDPSGDQHGALLAQNLKRRDPDLKISALGGTHLRQTADTFLYPLVGLGGFGFWEPLMKLPALWRAWRQVKNTLKENPPQLVIPIDYYGFNIHVARLAHEQKIPVVYYISPQVWASRPGRIQKLAQVVNKILVIFPFEEDLYRAAGVPVRFVGHPLVEQLPQPVSPNGKLSIGLLPGSRLHVVRRHLPILLQTAQRLHSLIPEATFLLFRPAEIDASFYQPFLESTPWVKLVYDPDYADRKNLTLAISVSGTAALENTLLGIPMIVMYKLSFLTYTIARLLIRVPYIAIPNLLAKKAIVPELLQSQATPEKLTLAVQTLLKNPRAIQHMREELLSLRALLGRDGSAESVVNEIEQILRAKKAA